MYRSKSGHGGRRGARTEGVFCNYPHRICMQDRYEGYEYCLDHILEEKSAPFKQCNFVSTKTGQKCQKAAPKADRREGYCPAHSRKAAQMRHKAALKAKPTDAVKDTLEDLDYYRPKSTKSVPDVPPSLATKILDYGSESESEGDPLMLEQAWRGTTDSDAESVDSEQEDALRCAGVYTAEEAAVITKDKLIRLQSLYINQFKRLQHIMREKRRSYLVALAKEREAFGIDFGVITDPKQKRKFREYQSARGFRRRKGKEALLYMKSKKRRIQATPDYQGKQKVPLMLQCCYKSDSEEQCTHFSLPLAKFCKDHILHDPKQVLYKECSKGEGHCDRPASILAPGDSCSLHIGLPDHVQYKPYEPEPPPPPPQPKSRPPPPPKIIPLPEAILPPAPVLPSQLDSQIDQLLKFQPQFLEQQLQQHVYDASRCMGAFAPPDVDMQVDSAGETTRALQRKAGRPRGKPDASEDVQMDTTPAAAAENQNGQMAQVQEDAQTDIHVDVETDADGPPEARPSDVKEDVDVEYEVSVEQDAKTSGTTEEKDAVQQEPETPMEVDSAAVAESGILEGVTSLDDDNSKTSLMAESSSEASSLADVQHGSAAAPSTDVVDLASESPKVLDVADDMATSEVTAIANDVLEKATSVATPADDVTDNPDKALQTQNASEQKADETVPAEPTKASKGEDIQADRSIPESEGSSDDGKAESMESKAESMESTKVDDATKEEKSIQLPESSKSPDQTSQSSPVSSEDTAAHQATGDHTYNQAPLSTEETGDQVIDVT